MREHKLAALAHQQRMQADTLAALLGFAQALFEACR
jgi:hypothetical protein